MISKEEVLKIAKLSKLRLNEDELSEMQESMTKILDYIDILNEVDVLNVEPLYNVNEIVDRTREDIEKNTVKKQDFLSNAPEKDEDFVILTKIV